MNIVEIAVKELRPYEKNAKKHDQTQIENVAKSIEKYGFVQPIVVDKNNEVIIGHCRLEASKKLKLKKVPCVLADTLTDEQVKELRLLDNKLNESDWDFDLLGEELEDLNLGDFDLDWGVEDNLQSDIEQIKEEPEVEFTEIMNEESNYLILKFDTDIDWLQAQSLFEIKEKKAYSTRTDGKINDKMVRKGIGRVINGAEFMNKIMEIVK